MPRCGQHPYTAGQPFDGICRICWLEANRPEYRERWADAPAIKIVRGNPPQRTPIHPAGPCVHFGEVLRTETCRMCGRRGKQEPIHSCAIWQECSTRPYKHSQPEAVCRGCEQYQPPPLAMTPEEIARLNLPPGHPPPPHDLTPLPAGRNSFVGSEWRRLPDSHKAYYRELKRAKDALAPPTPEPATHPAEHSIPPASDKTPFLSPHDMRPIHLSHYGQGASAFVVLSGPSLLDYDLSHLSRRGIFTIGVNNAPTLVRTNAWTFVDTPGKFHDGIWRDPGCMKFVTRTMFRRQVRTRGADGKLTAITDRDGRPILAHEMPGVIGINRNADFDPSRWLSEPSINWGQSKKSESRSRGKYPQTLNVMFCVLKIVYALGFRVVYLLGCDFSMSAERPYAFAQTKTPGAAASNNGSYSKLNEMLGLLQPHFLSAGFHVFNCNATSGLTVFPHVPYKTAIDTATGQTPQGVLDAAGWYDGFGGN